MSDMTGLDRFCDLERERLRAGGDIDVDAARAIFRAQREAEAQHRSELSLRVLKLQKRIQELEEFVRDVRDNDSSPLCFMPMMKRRAAEILKGRTSK